MERSHFDVVVVGGGMAGVCATVAAAREGAHVLVAERNGYFGGAATAGAVGQFVGWATAGGRRVVAGVALEIVDRLVAAGGSDGFSTFVMSTGHHMDRVEYDTEVLKVVLDGIVTEGGATVLLDSQVAAVERQGRRVSGIEFLTKGGRLPVALRTLIDASGDADALAMAGVEFLPLEAAEELQPATMMFRMGPLDFAALDAVAPEEKREIARRGVATGALPRAALHCSRVPGTDDAWFNVTRVPVDAIDPLALSRAEMEGRRQALEASRFIRDSLPGCARARLLAFAPQLGVRETRRIRGDYVIEADDLRDGRSFEDTVCCGAYPIDIHHARGAGLTIEQFGDAHYYRVPLRALVPVSLDNAVTAGRTVSATHTAHGALRVMPLAMAMGQAAGTVAALAGQTQGDVRRVPAGEVRARLAGAGAFLGDAP